MPTCLDNPLVGQHNAIRVPGEHAVHLLAGGRLIANQRVLEQHRAPLPAAHQKGHDPREKAGLVRQTLDAKPNLFGYGTLLTALTRKILRSLGTRGRMKK